MHNFLTKIAIKMKYAVNIVITTERMCGNGIIIHFSQYSTSPKKQETQTPKRSVY